jgi:hypothetical protein
MDDQLLPSMASDPRWAENWQELGHGVPTLMGLARICCQSIVSGPNKAAPLSPEARALLYAARQRGVLEIKGANRAFEAPARMLAVHVEVTPELTLIFRSRTNPEYTIRFLAGFRELCAAGLVMHHIFQEFSLTREGLELAQTIPPEEVETLVAQAKELSLYE